MPEEPKSATGTSYHVGDVGAGARVAVGTTFLGSKG